jgi:hypothetical protein
LLAKCLTHHIANILADWSDTFDIENREP